MGTAELQEAPAVANNNVVSLEITLSQMLDLALGTPEIGVVNFNILHSFLHVLLRQLNLQATIVKYRGEEADRIKTMVTTLKPEPNRQLHKYNDGITEIVQPISRDQEMDVEVLAEDVTPTVTAIDETPDVTTEPTAVRDIDVVTAGELPEDEEEMGNEEVTAEIEEPLTIDEIPDVTTGETVAIDEAFVSPQEKEEIKTVIGEQAPNEKEEIITVIGEQAPKEKEEIITVIGEQAPKEKEEIITVIGEQAPKEKEEIITVIGEQAPNNGMSIRKIRLDIDVLKKDVVKIQQELRDLNEKVAQIERPTKITDVEMPPEREEVSDAANLERCLEAVKNVETTHSEALQNITERMVTLEKEINNLLQKMDSVEAKTDDTAIKEFVGKIGEIEMDMEKLGQTMDRLLDEKEERETHINALLAQVEILKAIKVDKEEIEDALADKADTQAVNRKVSHDRFNAACDDLTRGLEDAIDKLTKQELVWQRTLDEIQNEIASKVDKVEMTPLQDFIYKKLKSLQEKLKIMAEARREIEAAGTKKQLKDVQCISCDKDVVMKMEEINRFRLDALPCTTSIKPYLTYQLDQVRKRQKRLPHSRNMIQFKAAMQEEERKMKTPREEIITKIPKDHLCNRYCGGSHTITTPQQRVTRTAYFLAQWGPETVQLTDDLIEGKNGHMYRSRPKMAAKIDICRTGKLDVCGPALESQICEETHPERIASATNRKSLPARRNSAGSQRRNSKKSSKEPEKYPKILENNRKMFEDNGKLEPAEKPIVEMRQTISPQENDNHPSPNQAESTEPQDEIVLYETTE